MVMGRVVYVTKNEAEVEGHRQDDEKTKHDLLKVRGLSDS